jgi:hypothetical protein
MKEPELFVNKDGAKRWWVDGKLHRLDGPAYEGADGAKSWWVDGKLHRLDGPAVERANGYKAWYVDDKRCNTLQEHAIAAFLLMSKCYIR